MKKVLSMLLSVVMLFSFGIMGVNAQEEENHCETFDRELGGLTGISYPYSLEDIAFAEYLNLHILDNKYISGENVWSYPAKDFEEMATSHFDFTVEELHTLNVVLSSHLDLKNTLRYDSETNTYIFENFWQGGGASSETPYWTVYNMFGYEKSGNDYIVYFAEEIFGGRYGYDTPEEFLADLGFTKEELGDKYREEYYTEEDGEDFAGTWSGSYVLTGYEKFTVSLNGEHCKIKNHEKTKTAPNKDNLITPDTEVVPPQIDYDTPEGVEIEGDTAFEEGTIVKVENVASGEIYERAEKALSNIADENKIAVFEFSATKDNTAVQPNGKVKVSFALPSNLSADNLKMFYVTEDSKTEEIAITVDKENKTVTAELEHFSTYVLCNVKTTPPTDTDTTNGNDTTSNETTNPQTGETTNIALLAVLMFASLSALAVLTYIKKKQHNH